MLVSPPKADTAAQYSRLCFPSVSISEHAWSSTAWTSSRTSRNASVYGTDLRLCSPTCPVSWARRAHAATSEIVARATGIELDDVVRPPEAGASVRSNTRTRGQVFAARGNGVTTFPPRTHVEAS